MKRAMTRFGALLPALLLTFFVAACGVDDGVSVDGEGNLLDETGTTVTVLLTDAPADYIATAEVNIGRVELIPSDDGDGEPVLLSEDGTDGFVNLLDFQDAATMQLAQADIEPGAYSQLRLIVESARVSLVEGYTFRDGSTEKDLFVPSGAQTGIKLNLHDDDETEAFEILEGETVLVLDFDVNQSFVLRGNFETPAGVHGVNFKPTLRVTVRDVAASISGMVSSAEGGPDVEGLTVRATPLDEGDVPGYQTETGTALTAGDGSYTIHFLVPGEYEVTVDLDEGVTSDPESHTVELGESEDATGVDFELMEVSGSISGNVSVAEGVEADVEGLTVSALSDAEGAVAIETMTDADGNYTVGSLLPGTYTVSVEVGEDLATEPVETSVEVGTDEDVTGIDFVIVEDVTGTISGEVTTILGGVSVDGLTVVATPAAEGAEPVTAETVEGAYTIESVPPGDYTVTVEVGEGLATNPESVDVTVAEDGAVTDVDFELLPSSQ